MAVTIKDVAKVARVSPSTVSRVIADNPRISEETKKRVREAMIELGYHPNFQARSLAVKSTQSIGIIMPNSATKVLENPFFPEVLRGISQVAREIAMAFIYLQVPIKRKSSRKLYKWFKEDELMELFFYTRKQMTRHELFIRGGFSLHCHWTAI